MNKKAVIFTGLVKVDENLVGTAVIYKKIADIFIAQGYQVVMVVPEETNIKNTTIKFKVYNEKNNRQEIDSSSLVVFGAYPPVKPLLCAYRKSKIIMTYLWSIAPIGSLEFKDFKNRDEQVKLHRFITSSYNLSLLLSDKIFCRDADVKKLVFGSLISLGRLNMENYATDKQFVNLIEVAPFGIETGRPKSATNIYRKRYKDIGKDDFILLWNGGVWNWHDGITLVKVMNKLKGRKIKLIFQGFQHPGNREKISQEAKQCMALAKRLRLKDRNIFFMDEWIPYRNREGFLTESDAGIVSSPNIPEANLFFKTRIYDYFWSELPVILNDCEAFSGIIKERRLGLVVKTGDVDDWARQIILLSKDAGLRREIKRNIKEYKREIGWDETLKPIERFSRKPLRSRDNKDPNNSLIRKNIKLNIQLS